MFPVGFPQSSGKDQLTAYGFQRLADATLVNDLAINTVLTFLGLSGYRVIKMVFAVRSTSVSGNDLSVRFNSDSAAKYARKVMNNGTIGTDAVSQTAIPLTNVNSASGNVHAVGYIDIVNETNKVKSLFCFHTANSASAATAPSMILSYGTYYETINPINEINIFATANPIQAGSRFTVYGLK